MRTRLLHVTRESIRARAPKNFGEAIILQMQETQKNQPSDPRLNPAAPMGLNARSMVRA